MLETVKWRTSWQCVPSSLLETRATPAPSFGNEGGVFFICEELTTEDTEDAEETLLRVCLGS